MKQTTVKRVLWGLSLLLASGVQAENMFCNGNFEHGSAGYGIGIYQNYHKTTPVFLPAETGKGRVLELSIPPTTPVDVTLPELLMQPGTEYELSFMVKTNAPDHKVGVLGLNRELFNGDPDWRKSRNYPVSNEWTKVTHRFSSSAKEPVWEALTLGFWLPEKDVAQKKDLKIYLTGLSLVKAGDSAESKPVTAALSMLNESFDMTYKPGATVPVRVEFINHTAQKRRIKFALSAENRITRKTEASKSFEIELEPGRTRIVTELALSELNAVWTLRGSGCGMANFVRIATVRKAFVKRGELPVDLGVSGFTTSECGPYSVQQNEADFYAGCGQVYMRGWDGGSAFGWSKFEPEDGKYQFKTADHIVDICGKAGLSYIPVVGGMFLTTPAGPPNPVRMAPRFWQHLPPHIIAKSKLLQTYTFPAWKGYQSWAPPMDKWENMVRLMAKRYSGRIEFWEILNESSSHLQPGIYKTYLKRAYEILKAENPANKTLGLGLTGDFGLNMNDKFVRQFKAGLGKYSDVVVIHPYRSVYEDSPNSSNEIINNFWNYCRTMKVNPVPQLWNTEVYYLNLKSRDGLSKDGNIFAAGLLARRNLIDAVNGLGASICLPGKYFVSNSINDNAQWKDSSVSNVFYTRLVPNERYLVSAAFANILRGTKFTGQADMRDFRIYKFSGNGKAVCTLYALSIAENDNRQIEFPKDAGVNILDEFGNPYVSNELKAVPTPVYLTAENMETLERFLQNCKFSGNTAFENFCRENSGERLKDNDFKQGFGFWKQTTYKPQAHEFSTSPNLSVNISKADEAGRIRLNQNVVLVPGKPYELEYCIRSEKATKFVLTVLKTGEKPYCHAGQVLAAGLNKGKAAFQMPEGNAPVEARVMFQIGNAEGRLEFLNARLNEISLERRIRENGGERLKDNGFKQGFDFWKKTTFKPQAHEFSTSPNLSVKISKADEAGRIRLIQRTFLAPGRKYKLDYSIRSSQKTRVLLSIRRIGEKVFFNQYLPLSAGENNQSVTFMVPDGKSLEDSDLFLQIGCAEGRLEFLNASLQEVK